LAGCIRLLVPPSPCDSPVSGSSPRAGCTKTGCGIMIRRRGGIYRQTRWGWLMGRACMGMWGRTRGGMLIRGGRLFWITYSVRRMTTSRHLARAKDLRNAPLRCNLMNLAKGLEGLEANIQMESCAFINALTGIEKLSIMRSKVPAGPRFMNWKPSQFPQKIWPN